MTKSNRVINSNIAITTNTIPKIMPVSCQISPLSGNFINIGLHVWVVVVTTGSSGWVEVVFTGSLVREVVATTGSSVWRVVLFPGFHIWEVVVTIGSSVWKVVVFIDSLVWEGVVTTDFVFVGCRGLITKW